MAVAAIDVEADTELPELKAGLEIFEARLGLFEVRDVALLLAMLSVRLLAANPVSEALEVWTAVVVRASDESVVAGAASMEPEVEGRAGSTGLLAMELLLSVELFAVGLLSLRSFDLVAADCALGGSVAGARSMLLTMELLTESLEDGSVVFCAEPEDVADAMLGAGLGIGSGLALKADDGTGCCVESLESADDAICVKVVTGKVSPGVINDAETDGEDWTIGDW
ncbi:MAG: hypothetical protein WBE52_18000 [Terriglobales bacterium]